MPTAFEFLSMSFLISKWLFIYSWIKVWKYLTKNLKNLIALNKIKNNGELFVSASFAVFAMLSKIEPDPATSTNYQVSSSNRCFFLINKSYSFVFLVSLIFHLLFLIFVHWMWRRWKNGMSKCGVSPAAGCTPETFLVKPVDCYHL